MGMQDGDLERLTSDEDTILYEDALYPSMAILDSHSTFCRDINFYLEYDCRDY